MKKAAFIAKYSKLTNAVLLASTAALSLYLLRSLVTGTAQFSFMAWNLVLSLLALLSACLCAISYARKQKVRAVVAAVVWLFLLPNTFYMLTDFVHVKDSGDINFLFDIVLIGFFALNGFMHGLLSLYIMHKVCLQKIRSGYAWLLLLIVILASSFAVDMGRYLRWNSWDVLINPNSLLFDVSDTLLNPSNYNRSFLITGIFFVTITSLYAVIWQISTLQWDKHE